MRNAAAAPIKGALDRRYASQSLLDDLTARLACFEEGMQRLEVQLDAVGRLESTLETVVSVDDPREFRDKVIESHRLANECARAIEHLSQQGILLRRDLNALLERPL